MNTQANPVSSNLIRIHSSIEAAIASVAVGQIAVTKKWKETKNQEGKQRGIVLPMECLKAPEVPESFRGLVEAVLAQSAENVLQKFVEDGNEGVFEVNEELFTRPALVESFLNSGSGWLTKQELELSFTGSATWKRIISRPEFLSNKVYQAQANMFKEAILKLTGKAVQMAPDRCEQILSKLEDSDLDTPFGEFVAKRLTTLMQKPMESAGLDML
jgi:hypothetical protein